MPLSLWLRGETWWVRGTVRAGSARRHVPGESLGVARGEKARAERARLQREQEITDELLDGDRGRARRLTIADAILIYQERPRLSRTDIDWALDINERVGGWKVAEAREAWSELLRVRLAGRAPATIARCRSVFVAALHALGEEVAAPKIPGVAVKNTHVAWLSAEERDALLAAYNSHAYAVALFLCFQGARTGEAVRLDWRHVDWKRGVVWLVDTKGGQNRQVPLHPRVFVRLARIWLRRGKPTEGRVFLSQRGAPYFDPREAGGNPLTKAHGTARKRAGIKRPFGIHDWRHHWATWMHRTGADLETIRRLGGWEDYRMLRRYADVPLEHQREAVRRVR